MNGGLWRGHRGCCRTTQADLLLSVFREARDAGRAVELPEIMRLGVAQHGARIAELRKRVFTIDNEMKRATDGRTLSRYWLRFDPEQDSPE